MNDSERKSCINTIQMLRRLALNLHGVIDVVDDDNCNKIIALLEGAEYDIIKKGGRENADN